MTMKRSTTTKNGTIVINDDVVTVQGNKNSDLLTIRYKGGKYEISAISSKSDNGVQICVFPKEIDLIELELVGE